MLVASGIEREMVGNSSLTKIPSKLRQLALQNLKAQPMSSFQNKILKTRLLSRHSLKINKRLHRIQNRKHHLLFRICDLMWMDLCKIGVMPYFGDIVSIDADAVWVNFEEPEIF